ncbi:MAG: TRAP transporter substrate-binding protein DctP [Bacteroidia bacterium]
MKKLTRKDFLRKGASVAGAVGLGALAACSSPEARQEAPGIRTGKTYRWIMVTTWPPNFPVLGEACEVFADWVREMSAGRLDIRVYGGGVLIPPLETFDAVSSGTAQIGNGATYYWAGKVPAAQFFSSVPYGLNAQQMNAWLIAGGGQALWDEVYAPFGLLSWPAGNTGVQMGGWFNKEITSLADLRGLKMRIPGLGGKVLTRAGGTSVNVAGGEIYTNLERGVIDATEWVGPYHDYLMGFHKIARYYYYPGWHEPGTTLETLVNRAAYEALPRDLQTILVAGIQRANTWVLSTFEAQNAIYLDKLLREEQVRLRAFPPEVLQVLRQITAEVLAGIAAADPLSDKVYRAYLAFQQRASTWAAISEKVYFEQLAS